MKNAALNCYECPNCLTRYSVESERCGRCRLGITIASSPTVALDQAAREFVGNWGGLYFDPIPFAGDFICACEGGVFRFSPASGIVWSQEMPIVTNIQVGNETYVISGISYSLVDGSPLSKKAADV